MKSGKRFESNFRNSVPDNVFFYRFRDSASTYYGGNENLRFSNASIADCLLFDGTTLLLCELKAHKGSSIPYSCIIGNKTKEKQIRDLYKASTYPNVKSLLIVYFEDKNECYSISIDEFINYYQSTPRKSIPISYFKENGLFIPVTLLRSNYRLDLSILFQ